MSKIVRDLPSIGVILSIILFVFSTLAAVTVGFDMAVYTVAESETGSYVDVCAVMHDVTPQDRLVDFEFNIIFFTLDGSART